MCYKGICLKVYGGPRYTSWVSRIDISTNWQSEIKPFNSSEMSFPSLQHWLSSVILASHVLEQTHQSIFPILVFLRGQSSWGLFCFLVLSKDFQLHVEFSQAQTHRDKLNSSLPPDELEDSYPTCDRHIEMYFKIY